MRGKIYFVIFVFMVFAVISQGCSVANRFGKGIEPAGGPSATDEGVRFTIFSTRIEKVCIAGDFNNWSMTADPLHDMDGTGTWTILLPLSPGRYEYKFVIDGENWMPDPGNPEQTDDGFGGVNSLIIVE